MAISQTMSNPNDWIFQPSYQTPFPHSEFPAPPNAFPAAASAPRPAALSPEQGRVSKPIRKRSRASRRTPTTLLNTDTANFRAMVQHFTGGPAAPFAAARPQALNNGPGGFHVEYPGQLLLHQVQQQHGFVMGGMHGGGEAAAPGSGNGGYGGNYMVG